MNNFSMELRHVDIDFLRSSRVGTDLQRFLIGQSLPEPEGLESERVSNPSFQFLYFLLEKNVVS